MKPLLAIRKKQPETIENKQPEPKIEPLPQQETKKEESIEAKLERLNQELLNALGTLPDANTRSAWSCFITESILYSLEQDAEKLLAMLTIWQNEYAGFISSTRRQRNDRTTNAN